MQCAGTTGAGSARACMPRAASKLSKDPWWKRTAEVLAACDMAQPKTRSSVYAICLLALGKRLGLGLAVGLGSGSTPGPQISVPELPAPPVGRELCDGVRHEGGRGQPPGERLAHGVEGAEGVGEWPFKATLEHA